MHTFFGRLLRLLIATPVVVAVSAFAQQGLSENDIRLSFLYQFARYVEWPDRGFGGAEGTLTFCMIGEDADGLALDELRRMRVQNRPIAVRSGVRVADVGDCQVVFIANSEIRRVGAIVKALALQPILTVSDIDGFIDVGGAIGIVRGGERMQFEVNRAALQTARLKASSHLLRLARNQPR